MTSIAVQECDEELHSWLLCNGYNNEHLVYRSLVSMCDTFEDLKSLKWDDLESHMSAVKVGTRRSLMSKIESLKHPPGLHAVEPALNTPTGQVLNTMPAASSTNAVVETMNEMDGSSKKIKVSETQQSKIDELLKKSSNRLIFGRQDQGKDLSRYEAAMNAAALQLLKDDPNLVSFSGSDVVRHAKVGDLLKKAQQSLQAGGFEFAKGASRGAMSASTYPGASDSQMGLTIRHRFRVLPTALPAPRARFLERVFPRA